MNDRQALIMQDYLDVEFFHLTLGLVLAVTATGAVFPRAVRRRERLPLHSIQKGRTT